MTRFLPLSRAEVEARGWDSLDVLLVTGDAYVDHPSFGVPLLGRLLEHDGYRVGLLAQPSFEPKEAAVEEFRRLGVPNLFVGIGAGVVDSMLNNYTANKKRRSDDLYSPGGRGFLRPDNATVVYSQLAREAFGNRVPVVIGGVEASLRRLAHYDYWQNRIRPSILLDSRADLLVFGMAERQIRRIADELRRARSETSEGT